MRGGLRSLDGVCFREETLGGLQAVFTNFHDGVVRWLSVRRVSESNCRRRR